MSSLAVKEGQLVEKNAVIARLDTEALQKDIEILQAQTKQLDVRIANTKRNAERFKQLYQQQATSERAFQDLSDEYQGLLAEKQALSKRIERIELDIRKSTIRAPFNGLILAVKKYEGDWLSPGSAVCALASTADVVVKAAVSEDLIIYLQPGDSLTLSIPALNLRLSGVVSKSAPVADVKSKTFNIKIAIDYVDNLLQNMTARVEVPVSEKAQRKIIKRAALVRFNNQDFVYTVVDGKATPIPIEIVGYDGEDMIVANGAIQTGMPVVIDGNERLRPDQPVNHRDPINMNFIKFSISKPVSVAVGVILVVLFGLVGIQKLPVQLTPDVETPQITVTTRWPGAAPYEVEKDIIEEQEKVLKGIQRLTLMESSSYNSLGEITLTFEVGTDIDAALLRVSNKLNEVRRYPENVEKPVIEASGAQSSPVIWMVLKTIKGPPVQVDTYRTFFENDVRQYLERVPGVGSLFVFGGSEKQLEVIVSPRKTGQARSDHRPADEPAPNVNTKTSPPACWVWRKKTTASEPSASIRTARPRWMFCLKDDGFQRVTLSDVASTRMGYAPNDVSVMHNGTPVIVVGVRKEQGANVIGLTRKMQEAVKGLNSGLLTQNNLRFEIVYEQTPYIYNAISLVKRNVIVGGHAGHGRSAAFSAQHQLHHGHRAGHSHFGDRHLYFHVAFQPQPQRGQPGGHFLCRGHAGGQRHRGAGKHRPPPRAWAKGLLRPPMTEPGKSGALCWPPRPPP